MQPNNPWSFRIFQFSHFGWWHLMCRSRLWTHLRASAFFSFCRWIPNWISSDLRAGNSELGCPDFCSRTATSMHFSGTCWWTVQRFGTWTLKFLISLLWNQQSTEFPCPYRQDWTPRNCSLTAKSSPMVSYCRWIFSAKSSKSRTMDGFSKDMALLSPEETIAGHVCAIQSQSCRLAKHTPLWFPRRQYKAPCGMEDRVWEG